MTSFLSALWRSYICDQKGTTAVEFALIATAFLALMFGIFETGRMALTWNSLQYALENATRHALVNENLTDQEIETYISDEMGPLSVDDSRVSVTISYPSRSGVNFIEIDGSYEFETVLPFLPDSWDSLTLEASSSLPVP